MIMEKFIVPPKNRGKAQSRGVCLGITLLRHSKINPSEPAWENTNRGRKAHSAKSKSKTSNGKCFAVSNLTKFQVKNGETLGKSSVVALAILK
jgi:hypothetical protein